MASPDTLTWDITPARRPSTADVGGCNKQQTTGAKAPDPDRHLTKDDVDQWAKQIRGLGGMCPVAKLTMRYSAGWVKHLCQTPGTSITTADFAVTVNGTGDVTISWAGSSTKFPAPIADHTAIVTGGTAGFATVESLTNSVRVRVMNASGVAANLPFVLDVF